jgi:hypothetical protein
MEDCRPTGRLLLIAFWEVVSINRSEKHVLAVNRSCLAEDVLGDLGVRQAVRKMPEDVKL